MDRYRFVGGPLHGQIRGVPTPVIMAASMTQSADYAGFLDPEAPTIGISTITYTKELFVRDVDETHRFKEVVMVPESLPIAEAMRLWKTLPPDEETVDHLQYNPRMQDWESVNDEVERLRRRVAELEDTNGELWKENKESKCRIRALRARLARVRSRSRRTARIAGEEL